MNRITSVYLFLVELLNIYQNPVSYKVIGIRDRILYGFSFRNITGLFKMEDCLAKCLEECKCMSFQICEDSVCQLCSTNGKQQEGSLQQSKGCTSFVFERERPSQACLSVQNSCHTEDINCCLTSQPCKNGASCVSTHSTFTTPVNNARFTCKCRPGYHGLYCDQPIKSCRGYRYISKKKIYYVIDNQDNAFPVYCQFYKKSRIAWTLILSYKHNDTLKTFSINDNTSENEDNPLASPYRLSSFRMESIRQNSTKWRRQHIQKNDNCSEVTIVGIDVPGANCTSCWTSNWKKTMHNTTGKKCNVSYFQSPECKDLYSAGTNVDNYGSYCCSKLSFHECPFKSNSQMKVWLGDKYA